MVFCAVAMVMHRVFHATTAKKPTFNGRKLFWICWTCPVTFLAGRDKARRCNNVIPHSRSGQRYDDDINEALVCLHLAWKEVEPLIVSLARSCWQRPIVLPFPFCPSPNVTYFSHLELRPCRQECVR